MPQRFEDLINQIAAQERVPAQVAQALVDTENPKRDPSLLLMERWGGGSYGLTMITLWTARSLGFAGRPDGLKDPTTQLRYGLRYLRRMFRSRGVPAIRVRNEPRSRRLGRVRRRRPPTPPQALASRTPPRSPGIVGISIKSGFGRNPIRIRPSWSQLRRLG